MLQPRISYLLCKYCKYCFMTLYISIPYCNLQWFMRIKIYTFTCVNQTIHRYLSRVSIKPFTDTYHLWKSNHPPIPITLACGNQNIHSFPSPVAIKLSTHTYHLWQSNQPPTPITCGIQTTRPYWSQCQLLPKCLTQGQTTINKTYT